MEFYLQVKTSDFKQAQAEFDCKIEQSQDTRDENLNVHDLITAEVIRHLNHQMGYPMCEGDVVHLDVVDQTYAPAYDGYLGMSYDLVYDEGFDMLEVTSVCTYYRHEPSLAIKGVNE